MGLLDSFVQMNLVEAQRRAKYEGGAKFLGELAKKNDILNFLAWFPASNGTYHEWVEAARLGKGEWKKLNGGISSISSGSDLHRESLFLMAGESLVDKDLIDAAEDKLAVRDSEDVANAEGFIQDWVSQLFYSDGSNADGFKGLSARRNAVDNDTVFSAGGSGNALTSLWLFEMGENGFNIRYPKNAQPGFSNVDDGLKVISDASGKHYDVWRRIYKIWGGLQIRNKHSVMRMCNIATSGTSNLFDVNTFIKMKNLLPNGGKNAIAFVNRTVHAQIEINAYNKSNMAFGISDIEGFGPVTRVCGIPIMTAEAILDTETTVS